MNRIYIYGRLTREPDTRYSQSGKAVVKFTVASDEGYGDKKSTEFIDVVAFDKKGESCANNLDKGCRVNIWGRLTIRSFEGNDGVKRKATEVIADDVQFIDFKKKDDAPQHGPLPDPDEITFNEDDVPW